MTRRATGGERVTPAQTQRTQRTLWPGEVPTSRRGAERRTLPNVIRDDHRNTVPIIVLVMHVLTTCGSLAASYTHLRERSE